MAEGIQTLNDTRVEVCLQFPPPITSPGYLGVDNHNNHHDLLITHPLHILEYSSPRLMMQIFLILVVSRISHSFLKRIGVPVFVSHIIAGMVASETLLMHEQPGFMSREAAEDNIRIMGTISALGYYFFLFMTGVKIDPAIIRRTKYCFYIGILTVVVPAASVLLITKLTGLNKGSIIHNKSLYVYVSYSMSSFPVTHKLLTDLKILNSELGRIGLASAMVSDLFSMFSMSLINITEYALKMPANNIHWVGFVAKTIAKNLAFVILIIFSRLVIRRTVKRFAPGGARVSNLLVYSIVVVFLFTPRVAAACNLLSTAGPYLFGLAVLEGPPLGTALVEKFDSVISEFFLPLFTATCVSRVDFASLIHMNPALIAPAFAGSIGIALVKVFVSTGLGLCCNMPLRDSMALAFILLTQGVVQLSYYTFMNAFEFLTEDIFTFIVLAIIILATLPPMILKCLYDPSRKHSAYQKRNIMQSSLQHDFRLLGCIHLPANVTSMLNLLSLSCPTEESPVTVDILHLVKLRGQVTPLFISHDKHENVFSATSSYSGNVVLAFNRFEQDHHKSVNVNVFTAVTPVNLMHEDICSMALDHQTSMIILPFHRQWLPDGTVEFDNSDIRSINSNVLDRSPCSVGILVMGRRNFKRSSSHVSSVSIDSRPSSLINVVMIFLGGEDDREALTLANRYALDTNVSLTVIHLRENEMENSTNPPSYQRIIDEEILRDFWSKDYVRYIEKKVEDGPEIAAYLRSVVGEFDLIIAGRRSKEDDWRTKGLLDEWSELPELGIIGDLLVSEDFNSGYSLLIVQQQQTTTKTYSYLFSS